MKHETIMYCGGPSASGIMNVCDEGQRRSRGDYSLEDLRYEHTFRDTFLSVAINFASRAAHDDRKRTWYRLDEEGMVFVTHRSVVS